ncbi:hypothetical protein [Chitinophaga sancti]|uniref:Uncharacterized protein n=1 Tax=Chitinophaga sancti TaxID=1004 RepID=A0A1K1T008_9BACT|nr:hypothetical protein [Chitinophaga sancti]WQD65378.1 hypothetical protein U0033_13335 [Chitinophaga sancti]WQG88998.1 hypothetical protein SR876_29135 [Chitinophaga sancti]SFW89828.1 hypothetical protein SAMN05661012_06500 [Chitinophaga sancti]
MTNYVFEWVENLINNELNPVTLQKFPLPEEDATQLIEKTRLEKIRIQQYLLDQFFEHPEQQKTKSLIRTYHDELVILFDRVYLIKMHDLSERAGVSELQHHVLNMLRELTEWFEFRYKQYLTPDQRVPMAGLLMIREEIMQQRLPIVEMLRATGNSDMAIDVVTDALDAFVYKIGNLEVITLHEADYHKELVKDILRSQGRDNVNSECPPLHELLVYWNLNTKKCITYFTKGLEAAIAGYPTYDEKLDFLHVERKHIASMVELPSFIYDPRFPSIKNYFLDYLENEIKYMDHKRAGFIPARQEEIIQEEPDPGDRPAPSQKAVVALSVDQIGILLRGLKKVGFFIGISMNAVYRFIIPAISTQERSDISIDSVKSKAYAAEHRDIEVVITFLTNLIKSIREIYDN